MSNNGMFRRSLIPLLLWSTWPTQAAEPPTTATSRSASVASTAPSTRPALRPEALVEQLRSDAYATRAKAGQQLAAWGEDARAALEAAVKADADPDVVRQARTLLARLEDARRYGPTLVTLHLRDAPAPEALAALAAQAGVTFAPPAETFWPAGSAAPPRVTLDLDKQPFWSAVQQLCAQARVRVASSAPGGPVQLAIIDPKEPSGPYAVAGPFLFKVKRIERTRALAFDGPRDLNAATGVRISLFCWPEPKIVGGSGGTWAIRQLDELVTDAGKPLDPKPFFGNLGGGGQIGPTGNEGTLTYRAEVPGARIARYCATARFTLPGKTETFAVDNVLQAGRVEQRVGGYAFTLKDVNRIVEGRYAYTVEVGPGDHAPEEFAGFLQTLQRKPPRLLDAQGQALRFQGGSASQTPTTYTTTQQLTADLGNGKRAGEPARFTWDIPVDTTTLMLPVEFTDLPLP